MSEEHKMEEFMIGTKTFMLPDGFDMERYEGCPDFVCNLPESDYRKGGLGLNSTGYVASWERIPAPGDPGRGIVCWTEDDETYHIRWYIYDIHSPVRFVVYDTVATADTLLNTLNLFTMVVNDNKWHKVEA